MATPRPRDPAFEVSRVVPRFAVSDLSRSVAFFRDQMDFQLELAWPENQPSFAILSHGAVTISLFCRDEIRPQARVGTFELWLDCTDVRAAVRHLAQKGLHPVWGPQVFFYGRREAAFADPDGHLVILSEETSDAVECQEETSQA